MEIAFGVAAYGIPLLILPLMLRQRAVFRRVALLVFFMGPLIGEVTYLLSSSDHGVSSLRTLAFWKTLIGFFPMAVLPLGLWAALLAVVGTRALEAMASHFRLGANLVLFAGLLSGGLAGLILVTVFAWTAVLTGSSTQLNDGLLPYALAGLVAGGISGLVSAYFAFKRGVSGATG